MSTTFARLEGLSFRLNETSDQLNGAITNLESKFATLNLNLAAWVKEPFIVEEKKMENGEWREVAKAYLGYAKINDTWRLWIRSEDGEVNSREGNGDERNGGKGNGDERNGGEGIKKSVFPNFTPLFQAPREFRVKALLQIPLLVTELENTTEALLEEFETAKMIAEMVSI